MTESGKSAESDDLVAYRRVVDEQAIIDTAIRYTWALDAKDWPALDQVFTSDATANLGDGMLMEGRQAILDKCSAALGPLADSQHIVGNHQVVLDGDRATHRCYLHAQHVPTRKSGKGLWICAGRYEDRMIRTDSGWRIEHRDLVAMWTQGDHTVISGAGSDPAN